jgi:hypothetical protein
VSIGLAAAPALAQSDADRATARSLGIEGQQALENKDYKTAEDRYRRADSLVHAPTLLLGLARALAGEGKYVEAQETYNRIVREGVPPTAPDPFKRALADAKREVDGVSPKIAGVTISVRSSGGGEVANPKVVLDGAPINAASLGVRRSIDPGSHVLQVSADGFKAAELHFDVAEAGSANEAVALDPDLSAAAAGPSNGAAAPAGTPSAGSAGPAAGASMTVVPSSGGGGGARGVLPWVAFGIGGAGLITGAITGGLAMGKHSDLANSGHCVGMACDDTQQSNLSSYHTVATISTVGFIVGGVGVAAGVVLLLTQPKAETVGGAPSPHVSLQVTPVVGVVGPGSIGAIGTF